MPQKSSDKKSVAYKTQKLTHKHTHIHVHTALCSDRNGTNEREKQKGSEH